MLFICSICQFETVQRSSLQFFSVLRNYFNPDFYIFYFCGNKVDFTTQIKTVFINYVVGNIETLFIFFSAWGLFLVLGVGVLVTRDFYFSNVYRSMRVTVFVIFLGFYLLITTCNFSCTSSIRWYVLLILPTCYTNFKGFTILSYHHLFF